MAIQPRSFLLHQEAGQSRGTDCPNLPGCISQGKTKVEAIANIKEAIKGYIAALEEDGLPVPEERFEAMPQRYRGLDGPEGKL